MAKIRMTRKRWIILGIVLFVVVIIAVPIALAGQIADRLTCDRGSARTTLEGPVKQEWAVRYHCRGDGFNEANALAVDQQGNVYVTGRGDCGSAGYFNYVTVKYARDGKRQWVAQYDGPVHSNDFSTGIVVDGWGNTYVTGAIMVVRQNEPPRVAHNCAIVEYDNEGNRLWVARYPGSDADGYAWNIALDGLGHVYVTGNVGTIKYDSAGNYLWAVATGGGIILNEQGDIYVTGDTGTVKYDENGKQIWAIQGRAGAIGADADGNFYIIELERDYPIVKYDSDGNRLWTQTYGEHGRPTAMIVDMSGNVYATGIGYKTVKYDSNGSQLWVARYGGESPDGSSGAPEAITVDDAGSAYVAGRNEYGSATVVKYDAEGHQVWAALYGRGIGDSSANDIALDASGNVYITGYTTVKHCEDWMFGSETDYTDFLTIKFSQQ